MSADAQISFIPMHDGQPSRREAWYDDDGQCPLRQLLQEHRRDRLSTRMCGRGTPGYIAFQTEASELLRRGLAERTAHRTILERLQAGLHTQPAGRR